MAFAAPYSMQTGYFPGDGVNGRTITGLGFQPDLVMIKDDTNNGTDGLLIRTSTMVGDVSLPLSEAETTIADNIESLDVDGFTLGTDTDVNASNIGNYWIAFGGSDCSASGTFCVGTYTGNGTGGTSITSVGFQPDLVIIKRAGATAGIWKSSSMTGNNCNYFGATAQLTTNVGIRSLDATGFTLGTDNAVNGNTFTYHYIAFKEISGQMDVGTYSGNSTDGRDITVSATTFKPNFVFVKPIDNVDAVASISEHYGDRSFLFSDSNSAANNIQLMNADGFEVGTSQNANNTGDTYHYAAFGGASAPPAGTGTFTMATGTYTGTGASLGITGLGFQPDLVIVKNAAAQQSVFRTALMMGDRTSYLAGATTVFALGITSLNADGFTVGTNATVNTLSNTYYWTAYGNAMRPDKSGGSSDFYIGQYLAPGVDDSEIFRLPIQPDLIAIKRAGASAGAWRTSEQAGDASLFFAATASAADYIQAINADGFQIGANASVNTAGNLYDFFMFKDGAGFNTGSYTGTGAAQNITAPNFAADYLWIKKTTGGTARQGIMRISRQTGDAALPFGATANGTGDITALLHNGFSVGTANQANENTFTYQWAAWTTKQYTQQSYRLFNNSNSTDVGTDLAAANTPVTLNASYDRFRLRMLLRVDDGHLDVGQAGFKLQYVDKGAGTCAAPSAGTPAAYTDVGPTEKIRFFNNVTPTDGATLTANANDPTDGGRTIRNESYEEANNITNSQVAILNGEDGKWDFSLVDGGTDVARTYCFRLVKASDGSTLDTYTSRPEVTTKIRGRRLVSNDE